MISDKLYLSNFGVAHVASQTVCLTTTACFHFVGMFACVSHFLDQEKHIIHLGEDLSDFQPMNSDLRQFRPFRDDVNSKAILAS